MNPIVQLTQGLINKIAAGEVVERPLSVVKELTENAIDAGATTITVEISDGGLSFIRITDNGGGISASDLPLAFARHATSKITNLEDLFQVETLGFRGEALSSIAAVAQVEMITKTHMAVTGTRVEIHGGKLISSSEIGCANGTTVIVSNLFYNTPARRKFLKKPAVEAGYIADCLERLALGNPGLTLRYINNSKPVFGTNGNGDLKSALLNVYNREVAVKVVPVDAKIENYDREFHLTGFVGKPEIARGNRQHGSFFINGRYIQSKLLTRGVESAMKTMLPSGKFPVYVLNLKMPFDALDVNVHPTKMDVRFADEDLIFSLVEGGVREALETQNLIPTVHHKPKPLPKLPEQEQIEINSEILTPVKETLVKEIPVEGVLTNKPLAEEIKSESHLPKHGPWLESPLLEKHPLKDMVGNNSSKNFTSMKEAQATGPKRHFKDYKIIDLIFSTYWIISQEDSMFLIDQHAAHERVLYEEILQKATSEKVHAQQLLTPITLRLTPKEKQLLEDNKQIFTDFGFEIAGTSDLPEITTVPILMKGPVTSGFFTEILDKIGDVGFSDKSPYIYKTELVAMAACKAAIKGGDSTTKEEAQGLIEKLLNLENPFTCPHGRPTIIEIQKSKIEGWFKRG